MTDLSHYTAIELFDACAARTVTPEAAAEELHRRHLLARERRYRQGVRAVLWPVAAAIGVLGVVLAALGVSS